MQILHARCMSLELYVFPSIICGVLTLFKLGSIIANEYFFKLVMTETHFKFIRYRSFLFEFMCKLNDVLIFLLFVRLSFLM